MTDWQRVRAALEEAGVTGVHDVGRFVNNTTYFEPSSFDEHAAMPVLIELLPTLTDSAVTKAVAAHLSRSWAKPRAFPTLLNAFLAWAERDAHVGWQLGNAMARTADERYVSEMLEVAEDRRYGSARQMVVDALWRFKRDERVAPALTRLIDDPDVALHAMSALRRTVGNAQAIPTLREVAATHPDERIRRQASQQVKKAEKSASR